MLWMQSWTQLGSPGVSWPRMAGKVREGFPEKMTAELDLQKNQQNICRQAKERTHWVEGKSQSKGEH